MKFIIVSWEKEQLIKQFLDGVAGDLDTRYEKWKEADKLSGAESAELIWLHEMWQRYLIIRNVFS